MKKNLKRQIVTMLMCFCMMVLSSAPIITHAEPAPPLSKVAITDLSVDENNEIHVEVTITGTQKQYYCWVDNGIAKRNFNEGYDIVNPRTRRVTGTVMYFHTGIYYTPDNYGRRIDVRYQATNARQPWNTLSTSRSFVVPGGE